MKRRRTWLLFPGLTWMGLFFFLPLCLIFLISFCTRDTYGGIVWTLTVTNYTSLFDPLYGYIYLRSFWLAALTTAICLCIAFPIAYFIARLPTKWQPIWLLLIMIPFWTNFLVRTYAWIFILRTEGLVNSWLLQTGLVQQPLEILYTEWAVLIGLVYGYLPFMILPLFAALERIEPQIIDAAADLYSPGWSRFQKIIFPLAMPGILAGCLLVFIPSIGAFITPDLLGGAKTMMLGNLIQHEFLVVRDWPFGSAVSFVLMAVVLCGVYFSYRLHSLGFTKRLEV